MVSTSVRIHAPPRAVEVTVELDQIYRAYAPLVHRRCRAILADEEETLDAVQDIFLQIQKTLDTFRGQAELTTWIYRVATNHCLNRLRSRRVRHRALAVLREDTNLPPLADGPARSLERRELLGVLLGALEEREVQILIHRYHDEMTHEEIAAVLGVTERTVRNHLTRVLERAREHVEKLIELERADIEDEVHDP